MSKDGLINVSVSSHYRDSSSASEIVTQGLLGEHVEILEEQSTHTLIRQADGYESWIPEEQLVTHTGAIAGQDILVRSHFVRIYAQPSSDAPVVRDAVIGCTLTAVDQQDGWNRLILPDGTVGWAEQGYFGEISKFTVVNVISLAQEFLGYQYLWGGLSPKGFDCSGFVQMVFRLHGVQLPRDSWQQQQNQQLSTDYLDAQPGDLLFFSASPDKVTHVAIALGEQRYIHASGWVRLESFREDDPVFSQQRSGSFTSVNRYQYLE